MNRTTPIALSEVVLRVSASQTHGRWCAKLDGSDRLKVSIREGLSSRCWKDGVSWDKFHEIRMAFSLLRPELSISCEEMKMHAML